MAGPGSNNAGHRASCVRSWFDAGPGTGLAKPSGLGMVSTSRTALLAVLTPLLAGIQPLLPKCRSNSSRDRRSPSSVSTTDFALLFGSEMYPWRAAGPARPSRDPSTRGHRPQASATTAPAPSRLLCRGRTPLPPLLHGCYTAPADAARIAAWPRHKRRRGPVGRVMWNMRKIHFSHSCKTAAARTAVKGARSLRVHRSEAETLDGGRRRPYRR